MKRALSIFRSLWYKGNKVHCNCCAHTFRSFVFSFNDNGRAQFHCPSCNATAEERFLRFFLQNDTSFYDINSQNILLTHSPERYISKSNQLKLNNSVDFYLCTDLAFCTNVEFDEYLVKSRPGTCFIFACLYPTPTDMERDLLRMFSAANLECYSKVGSSSDISKSNRTVYGLTSDVVIYVLVKPWNL